MQANNPSEDVEVLGSYKESMQRPGRIGRGGPSVGVLKALWGTLMCGQAAEPLQGLASLQALFFSTLFPAWHLHIQVMSHYLVPASSSLICACMYFSN